MSSHERPGRQRSQQPSDAEDGHGEGPDERNLPLIQTQVISLQAREIHQLLDVLHKPRRSSFVTIGKKHFRKRFPAGSWRALTAEGAFSTDTQNPYWKVPPMPVTKMTAIIVGHSSCGRAKVRENLLAGSTFLSQCCFVVSAS